VTPSFVLSETLSDNMIVLAEHEGFTAIFDALYARTVQLIEETNHYVHGEGLKEFRALEADTGIVYSAEAVQLGARLMLVAAWLLLNRAAREGDMKPDIIFREKQKIMGEIQKMRGKNHPQWSQLPEKLRQFSNESWYLVERLRLFEQDAGKALNKDNAIDSQWRRLKGAFGGKAKI